MEITVSEFLGHRRREGSLCLLRAPLRRAVPGFAGKVVYRTAFARQMADLPAGRRGAVVERAGVAPDRLQPADLLGGLLHGAHLLFRQCLPLPAFARGICLRNRPLGLRRDGRADLLLRLGGTPTCASLLAGGDPWLEPHLGQRPRTLAVTEDCSKGQGDGP